MTNSKRKRRNAEQIVKCLADGESMLAAGTLLVISVHFVVLLKCRRGIIPLTEVVQFAPDLPTPLAAQMSKQREFRIWLSGLLRGRIGNCHGVLFQR